MKRAILCEICKRQTCVLNARLHRETMMCAVRPGIIAEQVICREFDERSLVLTGSGMVRQVAK
jgi:hypothetical protein